MSTLAPRSTERGEGEEPGAVYDCAGKVFLLGEYAVLAGEPAIVAAVPPRFSLRVGSAAASTLHPASPAGLLLAAEASSELEFRDPLGGRGGLGASSAQFILAYLALAAERGWDASWTAIYDRYRALTGEAARRSGALPPSGADVIAQTVGGIPLIHPVRRTVEDLWPVFDWRNVLLFSATRQAGRKVATHDHLAALHASGRLAALAPRLSALTCEGLASIRAGDPTGLGRAFTRYAEELGSAGLELDLAREDRLALSRLDCVAGAKGAGALLADAVLVALRPGVDARDRAETIAAAEARGLELVRDGLEFTGPADRVQR